MTLTNELKSHFEAVLYHLETERQQTQQQVAAGQARLKELHNSILTLKKTLNPDATSFQLLTPHRPPNLKYMNISVRWAILDLLHESGPMATAPLADALKAAGVQSKAAIFANNVSAVLSTTMKEAHEVQQLPDGRWELTETGIGKIEHIRATPKFRRGIGLW